MRRAVGAPTVARAVALGILPVAVLASFAAPAGLIAFFTVATHRRLAVVLSVGAFGLTTLSIGYAAPGGRPSRAADRRCGSPCSASSCCTSPSPRPGCTCARAASAGLAARAGGARRGRATRVRRAVQANERARIAREMHDVLAHRISLLSMHAGSLEFSPGASHEEVARAAGIIRTNAHAALEDLREVIGVLRGPPATTGRAPAAHARRPAGSSRNRARPA